MDGVTAPSGEPPEIRHFEYVHDVALRPVLEQTSRDAWPRRRLRGSFTEAARGCPRWRDATDLTDDEGRLKDEAIVSERDARVAGQVLRVVMRDLDPGR